MKKNDLELSKELKKPVKEPKAKKTAKVKPEKVNKEPKTDKVQNKKLMGMSTNNMAGKNLQEDQNSSKKITERLSIKIKLTLSHVLILMIPVITIVVLLFVNSKAAILSEVEKANLALAGQVTKLVTL